MDIKRLLKKFLYKFTHIGLKMPKNCEFRLHTKIVNSVFEGANTVDNRTHIYNSYIGYATLIGSGGKVDRTRIGKYCSIGPKFNVIRGNHPSNTFVSTCNLFYSTSKARGFTYVNKEKFNEFKYADSMKKYAVIIENDVWIGDSVSILEGVSVGNGAIIAAGAMVIKDIPPYAIVGGVPAQIIRYRFNEKQVSSLLKIKWWEKEEKWIKDNSDLFENIDVFLKGVESNSINLE